MLLTACYHIALFVYLSSFKFYVLYLYEITQAICNDMSTVGHITVEM